MKTRFRCRVAAFVCLAAALTLIAYAGWLIIPQVALLARTRPVEATVGVTGYTGGIDRQPVFDAALIRDHDDRGFLNWGLRVGFLYSVGSHGYNAAAETPYRTPNLARILAVQAMYRTTKPVEIRYDPAKPEMIYLESGMPSRLWQPALFSLLGALAFGVGAFFLFRLARAPQLCPACKAELESYYKFCPGCAATVSKN